jgi:hypothetical protein
MAQQNLDFGTAAANDGETLASAFLKIQENFEELYADVEPAAILASLLTVDGTGSGLDADLLDGQSAAFYSAATVSGTAAAILASLLTVDGAGSGLDADLLDGKTTGTSGNVVPLLDGANTWTAVQTLNANGLTGPHINAICDDGVRQPDIAATGYGAAGGGIFHSRRARGSVASPTQLLAGDEIGGFGGRPYTSGGSFLSSSPASIHFLVAEDQTASNNSGYLRFLTTPLLTAVADRKTRLTITHDGVVWAQDEGTHNPLVPRQTKPWTDARFLAVGEGASGKTGASVGAVFYGGADSRTAGFRGGTARGTAASPTATQADDYLVYLGGHPYETTTPGFTDGAKGLVGIKAIENATNAAQGTYITFEITPATTTTRAEKLRLTASNLQPGANDGTALGASGTAFSDAFLASGAVINFAAGNFTLTHSSGLLTASGPLAVSGTAAGIYSGSGSPEGAVAAGIGSIYLNTAGGTDTSLYTKGSGAGTNTGWVAVDNV